MLRSSLLALTAHTDATKQVLRCYMVDSLTLTAGVWVVGITD